MTTDETAGKAVELEWFTWEGWNQHDTAWFSFDDVTVVKHFAGYRPGEKIASVSLDYEHSDYVVYDEEGNVLKDGKFRIEFD